MMIRENSLFPDSGDQGNRWLGSHVNTYSGSIEHVLKYVPEFDRRPFALPDTKGGCKPTNPHYDVVVRLPLSEHGAEMPIGIVSKSYNLVQHRQLVNVAAEAVKSAGIDLHNVEAEIIITEYGERMELCLLFPKENYSFDPGDGQPMGLRLECFNSVDGSTRFIAFLGWLRFVCSNGMVVGVTRSHIRHPHTTSLDIRAIRQVVIAGIQFAEEEKEHFTKWLECSIQIENYKGWIDNYLKEKWGVKAAARFYHIARTGKDAAFEDPFEKALPTGKRMKPVKAVPGIRVPADNAFVVSQILSWLAKEHRDVHKQLEHTRETHELMENFLETWD
ncbi:MAG: DUF932 domain-containing protein [Planctomycetota bacterium]